MATAVTRRRAERQRTLWVALCLLHLLLAAGAQAADHPGNAAAVNTTVASSTAGSATSSALPAAPVKRASVPPGCRTFYAHGTARPDKDGEEYTVQLLWREHAVPDAAGRWTLAVNVTATEDARVMLSSAARVLPGQPRYELVLGAHANESKLLVHADHHIRGSPSPVAPLLHQPLFEAGSLQLWLRWRTDEAADGNKTGRLEVEAQPADASAKLTLFTYETTQPLQVEAFSFGSTRPGDVAFTVCKACTAREGGEAGGSEHAAADHGLGVPGCRSLLLHKTGLLHTHTLAAGWADIADGHGRLQFWARASTDVEVLVSERLHSRRGEAVHHVVFGGDFNTKTWVTAMVGRAAVTSTPTLLSDSQFRPLWVSVPPHGRGVVKAGTGDVHHHNSTRETGQARELISWANPNAPAAPNFVTFATYRNRLVHVLIDCDKSPSLPAVNQSESEVGLLEAVRGSVAAAFASPRAPHSAAPTLQMDIERLAVHNGSVTATGTLMQEWQYGNDTGIAWNPAWFRGMLKSQYWLADMEEVLDNNAISDLMVVSSASGGKSWLKLVPGPIQVNYDKKISLNFHLHLKLPCKHDENQDTLSCSIMATLNSKSNSCIEISTCSVDQKWNVDWNVVELSKDCGKCNLSLTVRTKYHNQEKYRLSPQSTFDTGILQWINIFLTVLALITLCIEYHPQSSKVDSFLSLPKKIIRKFSKFYHQDFQDETCIVAYDGGAAHIYEAEDSDDLNTDDDKRNKFKPQPAKQIYSVFQQQKVPIALLILSVCLAVIDLFTKL
ncbi:uncharacterized protein LOC117647051 [Thrips palmi]|uniref:Uncharacterized protein LOC117647051 n=1 Tax=Thrips palmi TaxID=161013 RepID=A0A6P8YWH2_THRPL|nr:uncharacterized protein LOC117647051 [Thrips palmi]